MRTGSLGEWPRCLIGPHTCATGKESTEMGHRVGHHDQSHSSALIISGLSCCGGDGEKRLSSVAVATEEVLSLSPVKYGEDWIIISIGVEHHYLARPETELPK